MRDAMAEARRKLELVGVPNPARDVSALLDAAGHEIEDELSQEVAARFRAMVEARVLRHPVSHITGRRAFWMHDFIVTPDVLDPRPETETLVEAAVSSALTRVLDLGTGSGCILLSILAARPEATGLGTDVSAAALDVARRNAVKLGLTDRATFAEADWLTGIEGPFDLIVSNPPYIAAAEMADLSPEVLHEPHIALTPGGDGLDAYRTIAREAPSRLAPGGRLMVEIGPTQAEAVTALFSQAGLTGIDVHDDLDGRNRIVSGKNPQ